MSVSASFFYAFAVAVSSIAARAIGLPARWELHELHDSDEDLSFPTARERRGHE